MNVTQDEWPMVYRAMADIVADGGSEPPDEFVIPVKWDLAIPIVEFALIGIATEMWGLFMKEVQDGQWGLAATTWQRAMAYVLLRQFIIGW